MRAVTSKDAAMLATLHLNAYRGERADWDEAFFEKILALPTTRGFVEDRGFILWLQTPEFGEVITLTVMAAAQGQGIGGRLLQAYETALHTSGVPQSILDVAEDNIPAQALYTRSGYAAISRRPGYYRHYRAGREYRVDALVMEKRLQQP